MSDINLLPKANTSTLKQEQAVSLFRKISIVVLSLTAFTSVAMFILVIFSPLSKSQQEEKTLITQLSSSSNKIGRNVIIQERLSAISDILETRNTYEQKLHVLTTVLPSDVEIDKMSVTPESILITGKTRNVDSANTFFTRLIELQEKKEQFKDVSLNTFSLQTTSGFYNFILEVTLL